MQCQFFFPLKGFFGPIWVHFGSIFGVYVSHRKGDKKQSILFLMFIVQWDPLSQRWCVNLEIIIHLRLFLRCAQGGAKYHISGSFFCAIALDGSTFIFCTYTRVYKNAIPLVLDPLIDMKNAFLNIIFRSSKKKISSMTNDALSTF